MFKILRVDCLHCDPLSEPPLPQKHRLRPLILTPERHDSDEGSYPLFSFRKDIMNPYLNMTSPIMVYTDIPLASVRFITVLIKMLGPYVAPALGLLNENSMKASV